jgi:DNA-directed RNA polymerase subunit M/transcription elongation factor TFIIS
VGCIVFAFIGIQQNDFLLLPKIEYEISLPNPPEVPKKLNESFELRIKGLCENCGKRMFPKEDVEDQGWMLKVGLLRVHCNECKSTEKISWMEYPQKKKQYESEYNKVVEKLKIDVKNFDLQNYYNHYGIMPEQFSGTSSVHSYKDKLGPILQNRGGYIL